MTDLFFTLRVSAALFDQVDRAAQRQGVTRSAWIRHALTAAVRGGLQVNIEPPSAPATEARRHEAVTTGMCGRPSFRRIPS